MMRALAVDDDPVILDLLRRFLAERDGLELSCCETAEAAFEMIESTDQPYDCFLLDIMLPGVDGIEACTRLRSMKRYQATPIIMITASREINLMQRAFQAGATDFVNKPLHDVELGARMKTAGLLNESLLREKEMRHSLGKLSEMLKFRFDQPLALNADGLSDLLQIENRLLRLPQGCYAMTLFSLDAYGIDDIYRSGGLLTFRHCLENIASAAVRALNGESNLLAYSGSGRFVGVTFGRGRPDLEYLSKCVNTELQRMWDGCIIGTPVPPELRMQRISEQRFWSPISASNEIRKNLAPVCSGSMSHELAKVTSTRG